MNHTLDEERRPVPYATGSTAGLARPQKFEQMQQVTEAAQSARQEKRALRVRAHAVGKGIDDPNSISTSIP